MPNKSFAVETYIIPYLLNPAKMGEQNCFTLAEVQSIKDLQDGDEILEAIYKTTNIMDYEKYGNASFSKGEIIQIALGRDGVDKLSALGFIELILQEEEKLLDIDLKRIVLDNINNPEGLRQIYQFKLLEIFSNSSEIKKFELAKDEIDSIFTMKHGIKKLISLYDNSWMLVGYRFGGDVLLNQEDLVEIVKLPNGHEILDTIADSQGIFFRSIPRECHTGENNSNLKEISNKIIEAANSENPIEKIIFEYGVGRYLMDSNKFGDNAFTKEECDEILALPLGSITLGNICSFYERLKNNSGIAYEISQEDEFQTQDSNAIATEDEFDEIQTQEGDEITPQIFSDFYNMPEKNNKITINSFPKAEIILIAKKSATEESNDILSAISENLYLYDSGMGINTRTLTPEEALSIAKKGDINQLYKEGIAYPLINSPELGENRFTPEEIDLILSKEDGRYAISAIFYHYKTLLSPYIQYKQSCLSKKQVLALVNHKNPVENIHLLLETFFEINQSDLGENSFSDEDLSIILDSNNFKSKYNSVRRNLDLLKPEGMAGRNMTKSELISMVMNENGAGALDEFGIFHYIKTTENFGSDHFTGAELQSILSRENGHYTLRDLYQFCKNLSANEETKNHFTKYEIIKLLDSGFQTYNFHMLNYVNKILNNITRIENQFTKEELLEILSEGNGSLKISNIHSHYELLNNGACGKSQMLNILSQVDNAGKELHELEVYHCLKTTNFIGCDKFTDAEIELIKSIPNGEEILTSLYEALERLNGEFHGNNHITKQDIIKLAKSGCQDFYDFYNKINHLNWQLNNSGFNHFSKEQLIEILAQENGLEKLGATSKVNNILLSNKDIEGNNTLLTEDFMRIFYTQNYQAKLITIADHARLLADHAEDRMTKQEIIDWVMQDDGENTIYTDRGYGAFLQNDETLGNNRFTPEDMQIIRSLENWQPLIYSIFMCQHLMMQDDDEELFMTKHHAIEIAQMQDSSTKLNLMRYLMFCTNENLGSNKFKIEDIMLIFQSKNYRDILQAVEYNIYLLKPKGINGNHMTKEEMIKLVVEPNGVESLYYNHGIAHYLMNSDELEGNIFTREQIDQIKGEWNYHNIFNLYQARDIIKPSVMGNNFFRANEILSISSMYYRFNYAKELMRGIYSEEISNVAVVNRFKIKKLCDLDVLSFDTFKEPANRANANALIDAKIESLITPEMKLAIVQKLLLGSMGNNTESIIYLTIGGSIEAIISYLTAKETYKIFKAFAKIFNTQLPEIIEADFVQDEAQVLQEELDNLNLPNEEVTLLAASSNIDG